MILLHGSARAFQLTFIGSGRKCSKKKKKIFAKAFFYFVVVWS